MPKRSQRRCAKGWKNLDLYRCTRHPNAGRKKKQVVAVLDDGRWCVFPYVGKAAEWCKGSRENVGRCCRYNEARHINRKTHKINTDHRYNGIRFYFETDTIWLDKIKQV